MPRPLNFREIEAFRAVMQTGTTTAAAAVLNTTQPSVSRLLSQVGMATGLKLFDHTKGRLVPTKEARELFDFVQRQFLGLDRVEQHWPSCASPAPVRCASAARPRWASAVSYTHLTLPTN